MTEKKRHLKSIRSKFIAVGIISLTVAFVILIVFIGTFQQDFDNFSDRNSGAFKDLLKEEAIAIARLLAFEISGEGIQFDTEKFGNEPYNLCHPEKLPQLDEKFTKRLTYLMRILWENVTFNESINGIELIWLGEENGSFLTTSYYKGGETGHCPTTEWKTFSDAKEYRKIEHLMKLNLQSRTVSMPSGEIDVDADQEEGKLIEYVPFLSIENNKGPRFRGLIKVEIKATALTRFHQRKRDYVEESMREMLIGFIVVAIVAWSLVSVLFWYISKKVTEPIDQLTQHVEKFDASAEQNLFTLAENIRAIQTPSRDEVWVLKEAFLKLVDALNEFLVRLADNQRLMGLGTLAQGIAHEVFTPLTWVKGNLPNLKAHQAAILQVLDEYERLESLSDEDRAKIMRVKKKVHFERRLGFLDQTMTDLTEGTERMQVIIQSLRDFAGFQPEEDPAYDVHDGLESSLNLLRNSLKQGVVVHKDYADLPTIRAQGRRINQVFLNLIKNAGDAIKYEGEIWIKTTANEESVTIAITDHGPGISEKDLRKVFDPFFTTKTVQEGTGLGLSISKGIITDHQGKIWINSEVGRGTTVTVELPVRRNEQ